MRSYEVSAALTWRGGLTRKGRGGGGGLKEDLCYNVFLILSLWLEAGCFEC